MCGNKGYCRHQSSNMSSIDISGTPNTGKSLQFGARELLEYRSSFPSVPLEFSPLYGESNPLKPTESPLILGIHKTCLITENES